MRRIVAIVTLVALPALLAVARPAGAHACAAPVQVDVGTRATVSVGVTAESIEVVGVDVEIPEGFELASVDTGGSGAGDEAWHGERRGATVMFRGGSVPPFSCGYVSLTGTATERGALAFPLVLHGADGSVHRLDDTHPFNPEGAQMVYAGVGVPMVGNDAGGIGPVAVAGWVLIGGGLLAAVAWGLWRAGLIGR